MSKETGYCWHPIFGWADVSAGPMLRNDIDIGSQAIAFHVAHPDTKRRAAELVIVSGLSDHLEQLPIREATYEEIAAVHTKEYVDKIIRWSGDQGGWIDSVTFLGRGGYKIAAMAAGGCLEMAKAVSTGKIKRGYALVTPCGHHAEAHTGMGFCTFNNVAITAEYLIREHGHEKVAIVDWDVHHGNGSQSIFWKRNDVLTISLHQYRHYPPNSGFVTEVGEGKGAGYNINVPLPAGSGNLAYEKAIDDVVGPALRAFKPSIIIIACGADPNIMDPLSRTMVTVKGFGNLIKKAMAIADEVCDGKLVVCQEGGYSPIYVPLCIHRMVAELAGKRDAQSVKDDPYFHAFSGLEDMPMTSYEEAAVAASAALVQNIV